MFQPAIPVDGLAGWRILQRTYDTQFNAFSQSTELKRDTDHFREKIGSINTAEELVADRQLMTVALGAFGLQDDINNRFFIQKILEEGTVSEDALATRFTDTRYRELSSAFGFGPAEVQRTRLSDFPDEIIASYERQSFEVAVGEQSQTMRIALAAERSFADIADSTASETTKWFEIMGQPPLRSMFETVFNLPSSFAQVDIDSQQQLLAERSQDVFGTSDPSDFADPDLQEDLLTRFTAMSQLQNSTNFSSSGSVALALLQNL